VCRKFGKDCKRALEIVRLESNFNQYAINKNVGGDYDLGLWQINEKWQKVPREVAFNPYKATDEAHKIYLKWGSNFNAWTSNKKLK